MSHEFERAAHGKFECDVFVREDAELHRLAAGLDNGGGNDRAVAVIDAAGPQQLAGFDQLIAGRQHGDARAAHDVGHCIAARREHADFAGSDRRAAAQQSFPARDVGAGIRDELPARRGAAQIDRGRRRLLDQFGLLDHHHRIGAARDDAAGGDRGCGAGHHFDRGLDAAGDHFGIERQPLRRAVAGADRVGRAHGKSVDIGAVERRRIDRRNRVGRKHASERRGKAHGDAGKRRAVGAGFKTPASFRRGNHFEELLLARGAPHRIENGRTARGLFRIYGHVAAKTMVSRRLACLLENLRCRRERRSSRRCAPALQRTDNRSRAAPPCRRHSSPERIRQARSSN